MIIGFTGPYCSGKDTAAEYLFNRKGFGHYSLSDELRLEMKERGIEPSRENLIAVGTELRASEGLGVLARRALRRCEPNKDYVITSIRHPVEIEELRRQPGFTLVLIDAPVALRFERMCGRRRPGDPESMEKLVELEARESQISGPGQQLSVCARMADITLLNEGGDPGSFYAVIDELLERLRAGAKA